MPLLSVLFFPVVILYHELLLRAFNRGAPFFTLALLRILLFSAAAGLLIALILDLLPWRKVARGIAIGLTAAGSVIIAIEGCCKSVFATYFALGFMGNMAGQVVGSFIGTLLTVIIQHIVLILLALLPVAVCVLLRAGVAPERGQENPLRLAMAGVMVVCQIAAVLLSSLGGAKNYYTYDFSANASIPQFGVVSCLRLEIEYAIFGTPEMPLDTLDPDLIFSLPPEDTPAPSADPSADPSDEPTAAPVVYGYNQLDIDFSGLAEAITGTSDRDRAIQAMHQYFGGLEPSQQNEYTGRFAGKNLILLTAEGFCPYAIDEELTPTLYRLTHEGFVFNNFYQPDWTQSTCGGEFAVTTGVIPNWVGGKLAAIASVDKYMPMTLAPQFAALGYSVPAWHNHTYTYYGRNGYLLNFGYDYVGVGSGLELEHIVWPNSDLEMMQATVDSYIGEYVREGTPFHAYYMTVSGHGYYSWGGNAMSRKHRSEVEEKYPDLSETSQAYLACNMELDLALQYLVEQLEAAGIAEDTVIAMTGDHYPYMMVSDDEDFYNELRGFEDAEGDTSRYKNTFLLWSGCIEEPIVVDTPCSSIDMVPTLANLFGLEYDSRLYSGRDVFATNYEADQASTCMPLVVFANNMGAGNSWITAAGTYEASTRTFTPNEGVEVDDNYVATVSRLVSAKVNYAKLILQYDYYRLVFG